MRKFLILLTVCMAGFCNISYAQNEPRFLRIGETNPSVSAYVYGTSEQLSGQQFQTEGLLTYKGYQYTVYYNRTRNVCIARRKMPLGKWEEVVLPYRNSVDDAHNVITMGICEKDGSIHLAYDHHNDPLHYCYSVVGSANDPEHMPWEASSFSATTDVMDRAVPNVTYPRFISKPDGNLLFECRFNYSGYGDSYLREYDGETQKWTLIGRYVQGEDVTPDACAYINGMTYDRLGRLHVTWCWRDDFGGQTNHDFYYAYSEDHGVTWKDTYGEQKATTDYMQPVQDKKTGNCLGQTKISYKVETLPYNRGYINQETQAVDSKGRIHAVNSHIPDGEASDSNWGNSRLKARLHHRFRDTDGTWKKVLIKKNGVPVHSYCRVNLLFDAFDNAYVIANGTEIYYATAANNYEDWDLLTDRDQGRFLSEPLTDRSLLRNEGVLSFVYLGSDQKITVIDYLLDNPRTPTGTGLSAEYFSDTDFSALIRSEKNAVVSPSSLPEATRSVRWSGSFETSYGESYTMYLQTSAAATVYVDGVKVLLTRSSSEAREYSFGFEPIASHTHTIVIEAQAAPEDRISLSWSSPQVAKEIIPVHALYSELAHEAPPAEDEEAPALTKKAELKDRLYGAVAISGKEIIPVSSFNPSGDYSVELNAQIVSSPGCGFHLEARASNGKGFRIVLDETSLSWAVPFAAPSRLTVADNGEEQAYRLAVKGDKVYLYLGEEYVASADIAWIGDINDEGEEMEPVPQSEDLNLEWAGPANSGNGTPAQYGWENTLAITTWNTANSGSGVRFLDVTSGHTYNNAAYQGRIMTIRWDGNYGTYRFPVELEANTTYEFSMLYEWWNNGTPNSIHAGISTSKTGTELITSESFPTGSKNTLQKARFTFTTEQEGTYYLVFDGQSGVMYGIAELSLHKLSYQPKLLLARYCEGNADIKVANVMYEDEAYAPGNETPGEDLETKAYLPDEVSGNLRLSGVDGRKDIHTFPFDPSGDYSVEIAARISSGTQGRGMDFEVRDRGGFGFRTALNPTEFTWIAPFAQAQKISSSDEEEQILRYAVKGDKVFVFRNGTFVKTYAKQSIGTMNEPGTAEEKEYSGTPLNSPLNQITNPAFQNTPDNGAPEGWTSNGSLGVAGGARVQLKSSTTELSAYPDGTKAFLIRFDGNYSWFSNAVTLASDTWYEYSFDLIAWGNNANETLGLMVSTGEGGTGDLIWNETLTTPAVRATGERQVVRFKTSASGRYYLTLAKGGTLTGTAGITNQCLVEYPVNRMLVGKNYTAGNAEINIRSITFDLTGAFAPVFNPGPPDALEELGAQSEIRIETRTGFLQVTALQNLKSICIVNASGGHVLDKKDCGQTFSLRLEKGFYVIDVLTDTQKRYTEKIVIP